MLTTLSGNYVILSDLRGSLAAFWVSLLSITLAGYHQVPTEGHAWRLIVHRNQGDLPPTLRRRKASGCNLEWPFYPQLNFIFSLILHIRHN